MHRGCGRGHRILRIIPLPIMKVFARGLLHALFALGIALWHGNAAMWLHRSPSLLQWMETLNLTITIFYYYPVLCLLTVHV